MKQQKTKIEEPYSPEKTPNPPQIIDPSIPNEQNKNDTPVETKSAKSKPRQADDKKTKKSQPGNKD